MNYSVGRATDNVHRITSSILDRCSSAANKIHSVEGGILDCTNCTFLTEILHCALPLLLQSLEQGTTVVRCVNIARAANGLFWCCCRCGRFRVCFIRPTKVDQWCGNRLGSIHSRFGCAADYADCIKRNTLHRTDCTLFPEVLDGWFRKRSSTAHSSSGSAANYINCIQSSVFHSSHGSLFTEFLHCVAQFLLQPFKHRHSCSANAVLSCCARDPHLLHLCGIQDWHQQGLLQAGCNNTCARRLGHSIHIHDSSLQNLPVCEAQTGGCASLGHRRSHQVGLDAALFVRVDKPLYTIHQPAAGIKCHVLRVESSITQSSKCSLLAKVVNCSQHLLFQNVPQ
mmetsp:Transcript_67547/g.156785  ORF Transcript_67547/g.156785 Transcript_67547/m.156785 type:complete len:340 (+) Transcript_67547:714-1733(+)